MQKAGDLLKCFTQGKVGEVKGTSKGLGTRD